MNNLKLSVFKGGGTEVTNFTTPVNNTTHLFFQDQEVLG
jgi:hypothetical protein